METKNKILLKISWYIGLIAFTGGWAIFLTWSGGRYLGAVDFDRLEAIGFYWMLGFFWLCLIALVLLLAYVLINRNKLHLKMVYTLLIILINIPSVMIILQQQGDIENKVFVKLTNLARPDHMELKLQGRFKSWDLGVLNQGSSIVFNYDPPYWNNDARLYQKPDTLHLILKQDAIFDTIYFPALRMGDCKHLIIDKKLKIQSL